MPFRVKIKYVLTEARDKYNMHNALYQADTGRIKFDPPSIIEIVPTQNLFQH
jgi:hypothetical protein